MTLFLTPGGTPLRRQAVSSVCPGVRGFARNPELEGPRCLCGVPIGGGRTIEVVSVASGAVLAQEDRGLPLQDSAAAEVLA